jgi:hypothetical protein
MSSPAVVAAPVPEEKLRAYAVENEAAKRASADPLPGPLGAAFGPLDIHVDGLKIRPLVAYDWAVMKAANHAIYRQMLEYMQLGDQAKDVEPTEQEAWEIIYLLSHPCEEVDDVFQRGVKAFSTAARREVGMKLHPGQIARLSKACFEQVQRHMTTMVKYAQKADKDGETSFFPQPPSETASAGG